MFDVGVPTFLATGAEIELFDLLAVFQCLRRVLQFDLAVFEDIPLVRDFQRAFRVLVGDNHRDVLLPVDLSEGLEDILD